ncbi:hypothetical protein GCM10023115_13800 [Pontixanthobacter gangjinensis]|uniref:Lipoprotein n=1 Tax=Pontixanthobacter gangjinensis TaxID=1028742 RepID=A0A6I4SLS0_9SPHN|nr:hypothetical protein [Pontixanthobacter gangjinensis]MXO56624.1 hypothetical protein [Pontixanthobacter gangjinensis]
MAIFKRVNALKGAVPLAALALAVSACSAPKTREQVSQEFEEGLLAAPDTKAFWEAVKQDFPAEFDELVGRGVDAEMKSSLSKDDGIAIGKQWLGELEAMHGQSVKLAPNAQIAALLDSTLNLMKTFEVSDKPSCAKLAVGETFDTSLMSSRVQNAVQRNKVDLIRAMAGGQSHPQPRSEPAEGDYQALYARMRGLGTDERLMKILGDEGRLMRAAPEDQCSIGVFLYEAMDQLPEDQSARLGAFLLSPA